MSDKSAAVGRQSIEDRDLYEHARQGFSITQTEARRLAAIGYSDLVAALPVDRIRED